MPTTQASGITSQNRVQVVSSKEAAWGVLTSGEEALFQTKRVTGSSFSANLQTGESNEVRSDRMNAGSSLRSSDAGGSIDGELTFGSYDLEFESAMFSGITTETVVSAATISATATSIDDSGNGFGAFVVGQFIKVTGFTGDVLNNRVYQITTATAGSLTVTPAPASVDAVGETVRVVGRMVRNGSTAQAFTVQEQFLDHSPVTLINNTGMFVDTMTLQVQNGSDVTVNFGYKGKDSVSTETQYAAYATAAVNTNSLIDAVSGVTRVIIDGTEDGEFYQSLTVNLANNLRNQPAIGQGTAAVGVGYGKFSCGLQIELYFLDNTELVAFTARTNKAVSIELTDPDGNCIILSWPQAKYSQFTPTGAGLNGDSTASATLTAEAFTDSAGATYMFQIDILTKP